MPDDLFTVAEIAAEKKCSERTVRRWATELKLGTKVGPLWTFSEAEKVALLTFIVGEIGNPLMGSDDPTYRSGRKPKSIDN